MTENEFNDLVEKEEIRILLPRIRKYSADDDKEQLHTTLNNIDENLYKILCELQKLNSKDDGDDFIGKNINENDIVIHFKDISSVEKNDLDYLRHIILRNDSSHAVINEEKDRFLKWFEEQKQRRAK